jgi:hypothetical protein
MRRFFETVPGILAWLTLLLMFLFSRFFPVWISVFIILFDIYWLLKTVFLSLHLRATFAKMKKNMKMDWMAKLKELQVENEKSDSVRDWREIFHLVILPMYNEPYGVVRESFVHLAAAHYPKDKMIVVLALEERAGDAARETGERIKTEFGSTFHRFVITVHPKDLPDEIPGKGSNESWAVARAKEGIIDPMIASRANKSDGSYKSHTSYSSILVSVFDVDTQVLPEYFSRLTYVFLAARDPLRAIYQPVPLFTNNVYESGAFSRVVSFSCTFWQMMQQSRPERLTSFSSQSIPLQTLAEIGFWQKNIVSEDSRIFWQGFFRYHGDFRTEPLFFPVAMDAPAGRTFWETMKNIYKQQRRWAWGAENVPYLLEGFRKDKTIPKKKRWYWTFNAIEGYHSWATNALMIFALGWLPLFLGGKYYNETLLSYNLPHITRFIISLSMIGVASSAILSILLLPPRKEKLQIGDYGIYILQWLLMPFTLTIFGAIPGIEAQTRLAFGGKWRLGFWVTPKGRYSETGKGSGKR